MQSYLTGSILYDYATANCNNAMLNIKRVPISMEILRLFIICKSND